LNAEVAEDRYWQEPADYLTAEKIFEARWAMTVLAEVMRRLGEEYASQGKTATFEALKSFLDPIPHRYRWKNSKVSRNRLSFSWRCFSKKTRRAVFRTRSSF
jgi:hypothetical protein